MRVAGLRHGGRLNNTQLVMLCLPPQKKWAIHLARVILKGQTMHFNACRLLIYH